VSDELMRRAQAISLEEAWGTLRQQGYNNQFDSNWQAIHPDQVIVGRALTAQYMPLRPDMHAVLSRRAAQLRGWDDKSNIWPIQSLQPGDVYVADGYGKVIDGTLIGDILGNSIYARSQNGFVFDGSVRDLQGLSAIEGFNGYFREADPSAIREMQMVEINGPIRIGRASVLPGDLVVAKFGGVVFIPAHLAELVITQSEFVSLRDQFGHQAVRSGQYGPEQIDTQWTDAIRRSFLEWVRQNPDRMPMSEAQFREVLRRNNWDSSGRIISR
jgi:regulator of RNase E activity RraA